MAKKYYAVKNGYHIGIFETWEECQKEVAGYSGAEFKGFANRRDAEEFLGVNHQMSLFDEPDIAANTAVAYVDGSYNIETTHYGCGVVLFVRGQEISMKKEFSDPDMALMRNVAGEIEGAKMAMSYCAENNIEELDLYYDYEGVEKWCTGEWKTNKDGTIEYKRFYDEIKRTVSVNFMKVKGHSGDKYNDLADKLAKEAVDVV